MIVLSLISNPEGRLSRFWDYAGQYESYYYLNANVTQPTCCFADFSHGRLAAHQGAVAQGQEVAAGAARLRRGCAQGRGTGLLARDC